MSDVADELNAVLLPIPSEMRLFVFLASGRDPEVESRWLTCGGLTTFLTDAPETCGICLFRAGADPALIQPFYEKAGKEANVFQYRPAQKDFRRVSPYEFSLTNGLFPASSV